MRLFPPRIVPIVLRVSNARDADHIFRLLMGDNVEKRRRFIENNAFNVKNLDV